jgi:hypothetical protein
MNNYEATPEQWKADRYDWSKAGSEAMTGDSAFRCILELRARVEALEAQGRRPKPLSEADQALGVLAGLEKRSWVDTSSDPPVWKVRDGSNGKWITIGVLDPAGFNTIRCAVERLKKLEESTND